MISKMLEYKLAEAGGFYVKSPTRQLKPSQRCAKCWEVTPKTLKDRVHICSNPKCGHTQDRDVNAAQVNLIWVKRAGTVLSGAESPSSTNCGSMRQLGAKKRQKSQGKVDGDLETPSAYAVG
ncbi:zinc ribbon domain-containing protein [Candidatus Cyanaurora vandensis]|uniref:zinc ribbon domain-containing protein n=2 Tax=Candidatus Cyanaurora vandensis TaxID=2714958 RepID=UPI0037C0975C